MYSRFLAERKSTLSHFRYLIPSILFRPIQNRKYEHKKLSVSGLITSFGVTTSCFGLGGFGRGETGTLGSSVSSSSALLLLSLSSSIDQIASSFLRSSSCSFSSSIFLHFDAILTSSCHCSDENCLAPSSLSFWLIFPITAHARPSSYSLLSFSDLVRVNLTNENRPSEIAHGLELYFFLHRKEHSLTQHLL